MDYEKKYKEALERATKAKNNASLSKGTLRVLGIIFPELAESEDERIRKKLIKYFQDLKGGWFGNISHDDILAWLEKQGEQNFPILSNSAKTGKNWSEEDEKCIDNCCLLIGAADNCYEKTFKDDSIHYLQSLKERMGV